MNQNVLIERSLRFRRIEIDLYRRDPRQRAECHHISNHSVSLLRTQSGVLASLDPNHSDKFGVIRNQQTLKSGADTGFFAAQIHGAGKECHTNVACIQEPQVFRLFPCSKYQPGSPAKPAVCISLHAGSVPKGEANENGGE